MKRVEENEAIKLEEIKDIETRHHKTSNKM